MNARFLLIVLSGVAVTIAAATALGLTNTIAAQTDHDSAAPGNMTTSASEEHTEETHVVRDSVFADLSDKVIPANDFIHFYDTTPYKIMDGHVAAKLPCNEQSESPIQILIGQAPNMTSAELELIPDLSNPGQMCMYHTDLHSPHGDHTGVAEGRPITDIAILNPTSENITFPSTSTVVIGVNEIAPLGEGEHGHGAADAENGAGH
ncbi:MAG TPA: hypothetical protein VF172_08690 [Nitrososphaera sp.]